VGNPLNLFDRAVVRLINDRRDLPLVRLVLSASVVLPAAVYLYLPGRFTWWLAGGYVAIWALVFLDRVILMLHATSHTPLFARPVGWMNAYIPWVLGPFYGQTPDTYFIHHVEMHHVEENLGGDLSSTLRYRRDSRAHWLLYFARFLAQSVVLLPVYHLKKGNRRLALRFLIGELGFWIAVCALFSVNARATAVVFVVPVLFVRALMMAGNWAQHAFVDPEEPANPFRSSITCIDCRYNRRCFNDGYHIAHHGDPRRHWTELPAAFETHRELYGRHDAIVFRGIDFLTVWLCLMFGRWGRLARAFVRLPGAPERSQDEIIALLKARVQPIRAG